MVRRISFVVDPVMNVEETKLSLHYVLLELCRLGDKLHMLSSLHNVLSFEVVGLIIEGNI